MPFTSTLAIDNTKEYNIIAHSQCTRVQVQENFNSANPPTADLLQRFPAGTQQIAIAKGTPAVFTRSIPWSQGDLVGTMQTASGSVTLQILEADAV